MNFYSIASNVYDMLDITYFKNKTGNPSSAISNMIGGEDIKVLDMCCGTLANTIPAAQMHKNAKFYGIDISKHMLKKARQKIRSTEITNIRLKCADCTDSHIPEGTFDYIVVGLALHEMDFSTQKKILREVYRLLKSEGRLIVLEWENPQSIFQRLLFFPLLMAEWILNKSFLRFYFCDKKMFFRENHFEICNVIHCSFSAVIELKKVM